MKVTTGYTTIPRVALEQVQNFKYLGNILSEDRRYRSELRSKIGIAKIAFKQMRSFLTIRNISIDVTNGAIKTHTLIYGGEAWTISKDIEGEYKQ